MKIHKPTGPTVLRTWTRDGTTNKMGMEAAVANLGRCRDDLEPAAIRASLLAGQTVRTAKATFVIPGLVSEGN